MGNKSFAKLANFLFISILCLALSSQADEAKPSNNRYKRDEIRKSRFGDDSKQELLRKVYKLDEEINKQIFGQELASKTLKSRLAQYIEGFGSRTHEPISLNMVGLPGIGKSAIINQLDALGIQTIHFDAQNFVSGGNIDFNQALYNAYINLDKTKPAILIIEELDKLAEIKGNEERTEKLIGGLNQILSEGKLSLWGKRFDFSNCMILTSMNLSPLEISAFSEDALDEEKSFYDFTVENFAKFHQWISSQPSALPKILSKLFRSNTVSRLSPNTILLKPLNREDYRKITHKTMNEVILRMTSGDNANNKLQITFTDELLDFIAEKSTYAPSGSRNTVVKSDALTEQLIHYAKRVTFEGDESLNRPRKVRLSFDKTSQKAMIEVTPLTLINNKDLKEGKSFSVQVEYSPETVTFVAPDEISLVAPPIVSKVSKEEKPLSKAQIRANRFPEAQDLTKDLNKKLNEQIFGQEEFTKLMTQEMNNYLARPDQADKNPSGIVLAGFPGIGKSELMNLTGKYLNLPIVKINLQQFSSDNADSVNAFVTTIRKQTEQLDGKKYILLLEELDKVFEIHPQTGQVVNRPIMALIKDLLNDGRINYSFLSAGNHHDISIDVRNAFVAVTMNFGVDRFGFEADPRLTTIEDVMNAWRRLNSKITDLKALMGSIFLPETVNRLLARIHIMKPLEKKDYEALIEKQINDVIRSRFYNKDGKNIGQIELQLTPAYRDYLYSESVVPSEGARHTLNTAKGLLNDDLELLTKKIPKNSKFSGEKLIYTLDYIPETQSVKGSIVVKDNPAIAADGIYERGISLLFPPLQAKGKMSKERIITGIHEFGHAFTALRLGQRFEYATSVSPKAGVGGYVKFTRGEQNAINLINNIYSALGSRAMERIILSDNPRKNHSVLDITSGASNDIMQATKALFDAIHQFGFDPKGGTIERTGAVPFPYANFANLPPEEVEKLGLILRAMEDKLVDDLLKAHSQEWYLDKTQIFAREGGMTEDEFYKLVEYAYPGDSKKASSEVSRLHELYKGNIQNESEELLKAKTERNSNDKKTVPERAREFKEFFKEAVRSHLHPDSQEEVGKSCSSLFAS